MNEYLKIDEEYIKSLIPCGQVSYSDGFYTVYIDHGGLIKFESELWDKIKDKLPIVHVYGHDSPFGSVNIVIEDLHE